MLSRDVTTELRKLIVLDLGFEMPQRDTTSSNTGKVYINESLTSRLKNLLRLTKLKKRELDYKYVWTRNGKIHLRKDENADVKMVNFATDLDNLA